MYYNIILLYCRYRKRFSSVNKIINIPSIKKKKKLYNKYNMKHYNNRQLIKSDTNIKR